MGCDEFFRIPLVMFFLLLVGYVTPEEQIELKCDTPKEEKKKRKRKRMKERSNSAES